MLSVTPFLWFESRAEDAMQFYVGLFPDARVVSVNRAGDRVLGVEFELMSQRVMALNGGPLFKLNEAFSFFLACDTQEEIDRYWAVLTADGGEPGRCGWLKDKFGVSWQIVPRSLGRMLAGSDHARSGHVMQNMLQMTKLDLGALQRAYDGA